MTSIKESTQRRIEFNLILIYNDSKKREEVKPMIPINDDFTINKLIILYLLSEIKIPLSLSQITQIVLERGYTDYFSMQQYLNELVESNLITKNKENNASYFDISDKGLQILEFFSSRIPASIRSELDSFISTNWRKLRTELDVFAEYIPHKEHEYIVHCKVTENDSVLIDLKVNVASKKQAIAMCSKWENNASTLYSDILNILAKPDAPTHVIAQSKKS